MSDTQPVLIIPKRKKFREFTRGAILFIATSIIVATIQLYQPNKEFIFPQYGLVFVVLNLVVYLYFDFQQKNAWIKYAQERGFTYRLETVGIPFFKTPVISANYRGHKLQIGLFDVPSFRRRKGGFTPTYTEIVCNFSGGTLDKIIFELQRKNYALPREKLIYERGDEHLTDYQPENVKLNALYWIRTSSKRIALTLFANPSIRQRLQNIAEQTHDMKFSLRNKRLRFYQPGKIRDMAYLHTIVDLLVDMADCVEELGRPR